MVCHATAGLGDEIPRGVYVCVIVQSQAKFNLLECVRVCR